MTGVSDRPLLVLKRVGEGRVAQLLSDHAWLWARGFEGGGPQALLLRRLVHWLMKEPQLEEEALHARAAGDEILVERQSLTSEPPSTPPSPRPPAASSRCGSSPTPTAPPAPASRPTRTASTAIAAGDHTAYATPRPIAADRARRHARHRPGHGAGRRGHRRHGALARGGLPDLRRVEPRPAAAGLAGHQRNGAYRVLGMRDRRCCRLAGAGAAAGHRGARLVARRAGPDPLSTFCTQLVVEPIQKCNLRLIRWVRDCRSLIIL